MVTTSTALLTETADAAPVCVLVFNANDPIGAGGLSGDIVTIVSVGGHALTTTTGAYVRDTTEIFDYFAFDEEAVEAQARTILEDVSIQSIKLGFLGSADNVATTASIVSDYSGTPVLAYMPNLSWWTSDQIDIYQDAFRDLLLPQTTVLLGNYNTLWRWLLPNWEGERPPTAREIAAEAGRAGAPYTLVTGMALPNQMIENTLASPHSVLATATFERFDAVFTGAGDTLSAAFAALVAEGNDLLVAFNESFEYLDHALSNGFRPGMGHVIPDRLFWAQPETDLEQDDPNSNDTSSIASNLPFETNPHATKH